MSEIREEVEKAFETAEVAKPAEGVTAEVAKPAEGVTSEVAKPAEGATAEVAKPAEEKIVEAAIEVLKAPNFWKPEAKAHWDKLPKEVQQEALRRERESDAALSKSATARQFHQQFNEIIQPHMATIQAEGVDPVTAIKNLFQFTTNLRSGTPIQKATMLSEIIKVYDIDIAMLDQLLTGQLAPETKQQTQLEKMLEERLAPVNGLIKQVEEAKTQAERRAEQKAAAEIDQFAATAPHFDELEDDIADVIDLASKRGKQITLQYAYSLALALRPDLKPSPTKQSVTEEQRRLAGASIAGSPTKTGSAPVGDSVKEAIEAAWAASGR